MTLLRNFSKKIKKSSNLVIAVLLFLVFNLTAIIGLGFAKNSDVELLASSMEATQVTISNSSFSSYSGSSPRTPTSWTKLENDSNVVAGVIDIDDAKKDTSLKLKTDIEEYSGMSEDYVLLMNSPDAVSKMGYRSSEITLDRKSCYVISFKAYVENGAFASVYLTGKDIKSNNYKNFTTPYTYTKEVDDGNGGTTTETVYSATWKDCYLLVTTDEYFNTTATLDLRLGNELAGSKGAVLFDNITVQKVSQIDFNTIRNSVENNSNCVFHTIKITKTEPQEVFADNFENANLPNWEKVKDCDADNAKSLNGHTYLGVNLDENLTGITDSISNQGIVEHDGTFNTGALFINNTENLSVGYKLKENSYFTIEQNKLYILSFDAFTSSITGNGSVKANIYAENADGKYELVTSIDKISTSKAWKTYSFAINSNGTKNTRAYIEFFVEDAEGYALFDNLKLINVSYNIYETYLSANSETCKEADVSFVKSTELNNYFNKTYIKDEIFNNIYNAQKWTSTIYNANDEVLEDTDNNVGYAGVVNTGNWSNFSFVNPGDPNYKNYSTTSNNILLLNNVGNIKQTIKSSNFTITKDKYYEISLDVRTIGEAKAGIRIYNSSDKVLYEEMFIQNSSWTTHTINVIGGSEDTTVYFELSLGLDEKASGCAYFDNLVTREISVSNSNVAYSEMFTTVNSSNVLDLTKNNFANVDVLTKTDGIYESRDWNYTKEAKVNAGIVDTLNFSKVAQEFGVKNPGLPEELLNASSKVLMIDTAFDTYYKVTNLNKIKLDLDSYYKVTFWVLTQNIPTNDSNLDYNYGASIKIQDSNVKLGETFSGINTNGNWEKYTLYLNTLTNDNDVDNYNLSVVLALGSENLNSMGTVFFSDIVTTKIDQTEFDNILKDQESSVKDNIITFVGQTTASNDNDDSSNNGDSENAPKGEFSFLYFSTILTAVVILIAVVAFAFRSLKIRRPVRIKAVDLNKERMSARNFAFKDKMIEINNKLAILDDELFETNKAIDDLAYERITDSNKLEELKTQKAEIVQKMKDVKQEERDLVEQFKKFKKDEKLRKARKK